MEILIVLKIVLLSCDVLKGLGAVIIPLETFLVQRGQRHRQLEVRPKRIQFSWLATLKARQLETEAEWIRFSWFPFIELGTAPVQR